MNQQLDPQQVIDSLLQQIANLSLEVAKRDALIASLQAVGGEVSEG